MSESVFQKRYWQRVCDHFFGSDDRRVSRKRFASNGSQVVFLQLPNVEFSLGKTHLFTCAKVRFENRYWQRVCDHFFGSDDPKVIGFTKEFKGFLNVILSNAKMLCQ